MDYLDKNKWYGTELANKIKSISAISLILCSDGVYRKGKDCYFPTTEIEEDSKYPRVAKRVYISGKESREKVLKFLDKVGVREVDEKVEIETILEENYLQDALDKKLSRKNISHIQSFSEFIAKHPECVEMFCEYYIFIADFTWVKYIVGIPPAPLIQEVSRAQLRQLQAGGSRTQPRRTSLNRESLY